MIASNGRSKVTAQEKSLDRQSNTKKRTVKHALFMKRMGLIAQAHASTREFRAVCTISVLRSQSAIARHTPLDATLEMDIKGRREPNSLPQFLRSQAGFDSYSLFMKWTLVDSANAMSHRPLPLPLPLLPSGKIRLRLLNTSCMGRSRVPTASFSFLSRSSNLTAPIA
jgi:hypothetical protein